MVQRQRGKRIDTGALKMERGVEYDRETQANLIFEMSQAAEQRFGKRADQRTLRTAVTAAAHDLLDRPANVTEFLGALTINYVSRAMAH
jgi:hypothetical protein